jgi:hypothetical protein
MGITANRNKLVSLGENATPPSATSADRIVAGYPLFGRWARPVRAYADANGDGVIGYDEIVLGDSAEFIGTGQPKYQVALNSTLTLMNGRLRFNATGDVQSGITQVRVFDGERGTQDVNAPFSLQVRALMPGGFFSGGLETVSVGRVREAGVTYVLPTALSRSLRAASVSVALLGRNLAMWTNYTGKDPAVNTLLVNEGVQDAGGLPMTRSWSLRMTLQY